MASRAPLFQRRVADQAADRRGGRTAARGAGLTERAQQAAMAACCGWEPPMLHTPLDVYDSVRGPCNLHAPRGRRPPVPVLLRAAEHEPPHHPAREKHGT